MDSKKLKVVFCALSANLCLSLLLWWMLAPVLTTPGLPRIVRARAAWTQAPALSNPSKPSTHFLTREISHRKAIPASKRGISPFFDFEFDSAGGGLSSRGNSAQVSPPSSPAGASPGTPPEGPGGAIPPGGPAPSNPEPPVVSGPEEPKAPSPNPPNEATPPDGEIQPPSIVEIIPVRLPLNEVVGSLVETVGETISVDLSLGEDLSVKFSPLDQQNETADSEEGIVIGFHEETQIELGQSQNLILTNTEEIPEALEEGAIAIGLVLESDRVHLQIPAAVQESFEVELGILGQSSDRVLSLDPDVSTVQLNLNLD